MTGTLSDCCAPCPSTVAPTQIPGPQGNNGTDGIGINGIDAFSILQSDMTVPPDLVTPVTISVSTSLWMVIGQVVIIGQGAGLVLANPGPATFVVTAVPSPLTVTLKALQYPGDVAFGTTISAGAIVSASGVEPALATPWSIANGGTGAATKAAAQSSLGLGQDPLSSNNTGLTQAITNAVIQIGTIDVQLTDAGTWTWMGSVSIDQIGATFAANRTVTFRLRNITQGVNLRDITIHTQTATTADAPTAIYTVFYTDATGVVNDHFQLQIGMDVVNSAGTYRVIEAHLTGIPLRKS